MKVNSDMNSWLRPGFLIAVPLVLGCTGFGSEDGSAAPANPTYVADVKPILDRSCANCHSVPPQNGAPSGFRMDQYEDDAEGNAGVFSLRILVQQRVVQQFPSAMPPTADPPLSPAEIVTIDRWVDQGAPKF